MKYNSFYGDSIFCHNNDELYRISNYEDYKEFDRIFTDCIDIVEDDLSSTNEGANIEIWKSFNSHKKAYRKALSKAHLHMRQKQWTESLQYLQTAKQEIKECKKEVNSYESSYGSAAFGILFNSILTMVMDTIPGMTYLIGIDQSSAIGSEIRKAITLPSITVKAVNKVGKVSKTLLKNDAKTVEQIVVAKKKCDQLIEYSRRHKVISYTATAIYAISHIVDNIYSIIKEFRNDEKNERLTADKLNIYKNNILRTLDKFVDIIDKEIKAIKDTRKS